MLLSVGRICWNVSGLIRRGRADYLPGNWKRILKWGAISSPASCALRVYRLQYEFPSFYVSRRTFQLVKVECFFSLCITFTYIVIHRMACNKSWFLHSFRDWVHLYVDMTYFLAKSTQTKLMYSPLWEKTNVDLPPILIVHFVIAFVIHTQPLPLQPIYCFNLHPHRLHCPLVLEKCVFSDVWRFRNINSCKQT